MVRKTASDTAEQVTEKRRVRPSKKVIDSAKAAVQMPAAKRRRGRPPKSTPTAQEEHTNPLPFTGASQVKSYRIFRMLSISNCAITFHQLTLHHNLEAYTSEPPMAQGIPKGRKAQVYS